jgi:hypothetical protein
MSTDINITSTSTDTASDKLDLIGLDNIKADLKLELPQPLKTDSTYDIKPLKSEIDTNSRVAIEPLKTDSNVTLDLKPAVIDLCLTANVGKVPNVCVHQPYKYNIGFTLYGIEIWRFSISGEQDTTVRDLGLSPQVSLVGSGEAWPPTRKPEPLRVEAKPVAAAGGLRVRLGS